MTTTAPETTKQDVLVERLRAATALERAAHTTLVVAVAQARADGLSWADIGDSFDPPISRQAVWERFHTHIRGNAAVTAKAGAR